MDTTVSSILFVLGLVSDVAIDDGMVSILLSQISLAADSRRLCRYKRIMATTLTAPQTIAALLACRAMNSTVIAIPRALRTDKPWQSLRMVLTTAITSLHGIG